VFNPSCVDHIKNTVNRDLLAWLQFVLELDVSFGTYTSAALDSPVEKDVYAAWWHVVMPFKMLLYALSGIALCACLEMLYHATSASVERVFSMLDNTFTNERNGALVDLIELQSELASIEPRERSSPPLLFDLFSNLNSYRHSFE